MKSRFQITGLELSISYLSEVTGLDRRTVSDRLSGLDPENARIEDIFACLITSQGIEEARRRKLHAEAERTELRLQTEKGRLVEREQVTDELVELWKTVYDQVVVLMPRRIAERAYGKSEVEIAAVISETYAEVFDAIASNFHDFFEGAAPGDSGADQGERVGGEVPGAYARGGIGKLEE